MTVRFGGATGMPVMDLPEADATFSGGAVESNDQKSTNWIALLMQAKGGDVESLQQLKGTAGVSGGHGCPVHAFS